MMVPLRLDDDVVAVNQSDPATGSLMPSMSTGGGDEGDDEAGCG